MAREPLGQCRLCKAPVLWLRNTGTGRTAPIDCEPNNRGDIIVNLEERTYSVVIRGTATHTRHYDTCPEQEYWRERANRRRSVWMPTGGR